MKLAKNVSAVVFTRPMQVLVTRVGTSTNNWRRYPSMLQHRGFHINKTGIINKNLNKMNQNFTKQTTHYNRKWQVEHYNNYSVQMRLALRGVY